MNQTLATIDDPSSIMTVESLVAHAQRIQDAIRLRMREGEHYGVIPGTHKKSLYQAGAQVIASMFRFSWKFTIETVDYPGEHREVRAKCALFTAHGNDLAERESSCTTKETKYRYRSENTGALVPADYWKTRDMALLGGKEFSTRKVDGKWMIFHTEPTSNLADHYNTVLSMAQKRAFVAAVIAATAAADAFAPDPADDRSEETHAKRRKERNAAPIDPEAESTNRKLVLMAALERAGESGLDALLEAWQDLTEADRVLVGKDFGTLKTNVEKRGHE
jgi:hypothetical protein